MFESHPSIPVLPGLLSSREELTRNIVNQEALHTPVSLEKQTVSYSTGFRAVSCSKLRCKPLRTLRLVHLNWLLIWSRKKSRKVRSRNFLCIYLSPDKLLAKASEVLHDANSQVLYTVCSL